LREGGGRREGLGKGKWGMRGEAAKSKMRKGRVMGEGGGVVGGCYRFRGEEVEGGEIE